jgi:hypothetical protein
VKRLSIRILVALALAAALLAFVSVPIPTDEGGTSTLPAVALKQTGLYRLEVALAVFYGGLLLITPAFAGLVGGRLPIEISARGARFAERAGQTVESTEKALQALERTTADRSAGLDAVNVEIELLNQAIDDSRKRSVPSNR